MRWLLPKQQQSVGEEKKEKRKKKEKNRKKKNNLIYFYPAAKLPRSSKGLLLLLDQNQMTRLLISCMKSETDRISRHLVAFSKWSVIKKKDKEKKREEKINWKKEQKWGKEIVWFFWRPTHFLSRRLFQPFLFFFFLFFSQRSHSFYSNF